MILADEVGLGKTIKASLVIAQRWAERRRRILLIALARFARSIGIRFERENGLFTNEIVRLHRRIRGRGY
jgi:ERCC4-related helicase